MGAKARSQDAGVSPQTNGQASLASRMGGVRVARRRDLQVKRQVNRGNALYVLHDPVSFANHALNALEYRILCSIEASTALSDTFDELVKKGALAPEDEEVFYEFAVDLHGQGLLTNPGVPTQVAWERHLEVQQRRRTSPIAWLANLKISLGNPDWLLSRLARFMRWPFAWPGLAVWTALAASALWTCWGRVFELFGAPSDLLALENLPSLWLSLIGLKLIHELGHAMAIKRYGGSVPDWGVVFIFMTPCAYVDANSSWRLDSKWHRIAVGLGGMYVESMVAFVAALVWSGTSPGLLHSAAQNIVVLATVTTVLININPLIKFDGYFVLSDLVGIRNLQERASRQLRTYAEHFLLGMPRETDDYDTLERIVLWLYAPAAMAYRISLAIAITAMMASAWPSLAAPVGGCFAWLMILAPLWRAARALWSSQRFDDVRLRARVVLVSACMLIAIACYALPVSHGVTASGVLDPGQRRSVRVPNSSFLAEVLVEDGETVVPATPLCRLSSPALEVALSEVENEIRTARVQLDAIEIERPSATLPLVARIEYLEQRATELRRSLSQLVVRAKLGGTVVGAASLTPGTFLREGTELMQVHSEHRFIRVVLTDESAARALPAVGTQAQVRWTCDPGHVMPGVVCEARPSASRSMVPAELTVAAGGEILAHDVEGHLEAEKPYLHLFLKVENPILENGGTGLTAKVRFATRAWTLGEWADQRVRTFLYELWAK